MDPQKRTEIEALVLKSQNGDTDAFGKIYDLFVDQIYRYIYFKVEDEEAADLVSTVFLKAWENMKQYKPSSDHSSSFSSWLFRIAHNVVIDYYRFHHKLYELTEDLMDNDREHQPLHRIELNLNHDLLRTALTKLKEPYRQVLILKFLNELPNEEVSQILQRSEGGVRILQFRALSALKQELTRMGVTL